APNLCNDAHDCSLATADAWLKANIAPLIESATFQKDGLLVIVFDEAGSDDTRGGGRVACVLVGPKVKRGYQSSTVYQHESLLRLAAQARGRAGASARRECSGCCRRRRTPRAAAAPRRRRPRAGRGRRAAPA